MFGYIYQFIVANQLAIGFGDYKFPTLLCQVVWDTERASEGRQHLIQSTARGNYNYIASYPKLLQFSISFVEQEIVA